MPDRIRFFTDVANIEPEAYAQVQRTASMPFIHGVAVMPDCHFGMGSTVGTVVVTKGAVMPACVGVDIGCGMIAVQTTLNPDQVRHYAPAIREGIERRVPTGFNTNNKISDRALSRINMLEDLAKLLFGEIDHMDHRDANWRNALGSLGGGNHFIEVCVGRPLDYCSCPCEHWQDVPVDGCVLCRRPAHGDSVWVILHSGSRGVGNKTGTYWTRVAKQLPKPYMNGKEIPDANLSALTQHTPEYTQYMAEVKWCQEFARLSREEMMDRVLEELRYTLGVGTLELQRINCHHNFAQIEKHDGEDVIVTRKGAIQARVGELALIPGSMGARSYIVEGLGNTQSFNSAPHGAGRRMSRRTARETFSLDNLKETMYSQGIEARVRESILDEHPGSYKDIDVVMHEARELVKPLYVLRQLISVKGD